jgi:hypothetical protein
VPAALKRKIFSAAPSNHAQAWFWGCFAPAAACALLTLASFNSGNVPGAKNNFIFISSNQNDAAYAGNGVASAQNHLACVTFDWTNHSGFNSSIGLTHSTNLSN